MLKNKGDAGLTVLLVVIVATFIGLGSTLLLSDDNAVEEATEGVIQREIGWDIDFTPGSPER